MERDTVREEQKKRGEGKRDTKVNHNTTAKGQFVTQSEMLLKMREYIIQFITDLPHFIVTSGIKQNILHKRGFGLLFAMYCCRGRPGMNLNVTVALYFR